MTESKESIEAGIREVYNFVLERKNVTARYVLTSSPPWKGEGSPHRFGFTSLI